MNEHKINKDFLNMERQELWDTMSMLPDILRLLSTAEKKELRDAVLNELKLLDRDIASDEESAEFWAWHNRIHQGTFKDRMRTMRIRRGRSIGVRQDLIHRFRDMQIKHEIDRRCKAGMRQMKAIDEVADAANLSPERVKKIYQAEKKRGYKSA